MESFVASFGLAIIIYIASLFIKFSFGVGFLIWLILTASFFVLDEYQKQENKEKEEMKTCPMCAELIKKDAKKCKHCGELLVKT